MSILSRKLALAVMLAALCLGGRTAHAQAAPVQYWLPSASFGFGGSLGFDEIDASGLSRTEFPGGWFMASTHGSFATSGFNRLGAFGNLGALSTEGVQFGYNFKNTPLSIYSGFDALKYNTGLGSSASGAFSAFDRSVSAPGAFSANAGIEFRPTSNVTLSLGASFTQHSSGAVDSDINSPLLPGQSPVVIGGRPLR
jgi:opacity protein-like surface antigen